MTDTSNENARPDFPAFSTPTKSGDSEASANIGSEPVKRRGPGRPRKDGGSTAPVSPVEIPAGSAQPKGKPGRKPKKTVMDAAARSSLGKQIVGLHMVSAMAFSIPELVITEQEGELLANAIAAVSEEYGLSLTGKTGAALQLVGTGAMIYLPRFFAMQKRVNAARETMPAQTDEKVIPDNVRPITPAH